jgi:hypothetical protein
MYEEIKSKFNSGNICYHFILGNTSPIHPLLYMKVTLKYICILWKYLQGNRINYSKLCLELFDTPLV